MNTLKDQASSILLDIGGTYVKCAVVDKNQKHPQNIRKFNIPKFSENRSGKAVIPTKEFLTVIDKAIKIQMIKDLEPERIYVSGQMGGYVIEDSGAFEIISWQDKRSLQSQYENDKVELEQWLQTSLAFKETGSEIRPGLPFFSLAVTKPFSEHKNLAWPFRSVISFVTSYLTNFEKNEMHITDAAASGFFNLRTKVWDEDLVGKIETSLILPSVHSEVIRLGYSAKYGLDVFTGVGDQQASLLGAELEEGKVIVNIGTGGQVAGFQKYSQHEGEFQVRPFFGGKEIRTITHLPSGRALSTFVEFCYPGEQPFDKYKQFERSCKTPDFTSGIDLYNSNQTLNSLTQNGRDVIPERLASMFFGSLIRSYESALTRLNLKGELIFAGGVAQKVEIIPRELSRLTGRKFSIAKAHETTLEGLAKIASISS